MDYQPIQNYGIIGNLQTVALVGMHGSIDFLSFPYFDSPTVFAALLDEENGGHFSLAPLLEEARRKQIYLLDSNILLTRFLSPEGVAEISDFMPVSFCRRRAGAQDDAPTQLVRRAKTVRGEMRYRMVCAPRFDYARVGHRVEQPSEQRNSFHLARATASSVLRLRSLDVPIRHENGDAVAEFTLRAGKTAAFVLEEVRPGEASPVEAPHFVAESSRRR